MPGYKEYQNDTGYRAVLLPIIGGGTSPVISRRIVRSGFGHLLPAPPYIKRNIYTAIRSELRTVGEKYLSGTRFTVVLHADSGNCPTFPTLPQSFWNALYAKFREEVVGEQASLGIAVAQWRQSFGMVANRAYQLARAAKALYRGRFSDFLQILGISKPKRKHRQKKRNRAKESAGLWLEYSFGWKPLAGDIFSAFEQLQEPIPVDTFAASKMAIVERSNVNEESVSEVIATQRATILISNPNLFLTNQLGLVNIGSVIFDGIPFSFVLDWFTDCQLWIESFTDWLGLRVEDPTISIKAENYHWYWGAGGKIGHPCLIVREAFRRDPGMIKPLPNFDFLANIGKSKARGANAMSLLTQILSKF